MKSPSYFAIAAWASNFILHFYNAVDVSTVQSKNGVDLVEVSNFYKLDKTMAKYIHGCFYASVNNLRKF